MAVLARHLAFAKFRTGGTVPEAIPGTEVLLLALDAAVRAGVPFKCTAGLHHPIRGSYPLTYAGGYLALSAVLATDEVYAAFYGDATARGFLHSHSYTGNPLACRAALAVRDIFEHDNVIAANRVRSIVFTHILTEVAAHHRVRHFRHAGMIWAFDVVDATPRFSARFHQAALAQGVFIRPIGNTVYAMPPYVTSAEEMRGLADVPAKI